MISVILAWIVFAARLFGLTAMAANLATATDTVLPLGDPPAQMSLAEPPPGQSPLPMDPPLPINRRSRVVLALALIGLVVLGLGMVAMIVLGGRWVRRLARTGTDPLAVRREPERITESPATGGESKQGQSADTVSSGETVT